VPRSHSSPSTSLPPAPSRLSAPCLLSCPLTYAHCRALDEDVSTCSPSHDVRCRPVPPVERAPPSFASLRSRLALTAVLRSGLFTCHSPPRRRRFEPLRKLLRAAVLPSRGGAIGVPDAWSPKTRWRSLPSGSLRAPLYSNPRSAHDDRQAGQPERGVSLAEARTLPSRTRRSSRLRRPPASSPGDDRRRLDRYPEMRARMARVTQHRKRRPTANCWRSSGCREAHSRSAEKPTRAGRTISSHRLGSTRVVFFFSPRVGRRLRPLRSGAPAPGSATPCNRASLVGGGSSLSLLKRGQRTTSRPDGVAEPRDELEQYQKTDRALMPSSTTSALKSKRRERPRQLLLCNTRRAQGPTLSGPRARELPGFLARLDLPGRNDHARSGRPSRRRIRSATSL